MMELDPNHCVVAMSGGVDSAVTAYLLHKQGMKVTGLFMSNGVHASCDIEGRRTKSCCSARDARDAAACARAIGIEFHQLDFKRAFNRVIEHFVSEYQRGRTPNPCIDCNQQLKFGKLISYAVGIGAASVATGHYARVETDPVSGRHFIKRSADAAKDQTYVLFSLAQPQLARMRLPLGGLTKPEVRRLAHEGNLPVRDKAESQDICFVPGGDYRAVIAARSDTPAEPGELVDESGKVLARHAGIERFTIGQRKGLGVALGKPHYVLAIEPDTRRVVVGPRESLAREELVASRASWMRTAPLEPGQQLRAWTQIRYHHRPAMATITGTETGVTVRFDEPQEAITPGQAVCFYGDDGGIEGGAWID